jgi:hypothetical protein
MMQTLLLKVLSLIDPQMRAPQSGSIGGWLAMKIMLFNEPSEIEGIQRLDIQKDDVFVELGAGHGVGIRQAFTKRPKRIA